MNKIIASQHGRGGGTLQLYISGFLLSILLTMGAYFLAVSNEVMTAPIVGVVVALGVIQFFVQLQFFIHLGHESRPRWNKLVFYFMLLVLFIVVGGSLWIMNNLDYNGHGTTSPHDTEMYIQNEEAITR